MYINQSPQISIITTVYNIEKYLPICLDSILEQTFTDFELILIDDGSTDRSGTICDEYAQKDTRIHVIHQENVGVSDAWNNAMQFVKGRYTGFVDGDDFIHPRMYELLHKAISETQSDIAYCDYQRYYGEERDDFTENQTGDAVDDEIVIKVSSLEYEMKENITNSAIWRGLYLTSLIQKFSFMSKKNGQDNLWSTCVLINANRIARVHKTLYKWRYREESESSIAFQYRILNYVQVRCSVIEFLKKNAPEWLVPYTLFLFWTCVEAEDRKRKLQDSDEVEIYDFEINRALKYFSEISVKQIVADPNTKRTRKALAVIGKISFPLACYTKRNALKYINR